MSWDSPIVRVTTGYLNTVNDVYAGGGASSAKFGGQLGKQLALTNAQALQLSKTTIGTLYAGVYQYVKLSASATAPVKGQIVFWDNAAAIDAFQVTHSEATTTLTASSIAGVALSTPTAGQHFWIQVSGIATVTYVATITGTKATGRPVTLSVAGGASMGLSDIVDDLVLAGGTRNDLRFLGWAIDLPADASTGRVQLAYNHSLRG